MFGREKNPHIKKCLDKVHTKHVDAKDCWCKKSSTQNM